MKFNFRVYGIPKPGGSKRAFVIPGTQRAIITDACKKNKEWRNDVRDQFLTHHGNDFPLIDGPIELTICFVMPRLKSHYNTKGILKQTAPYVHTVQPDTTKLLRSTEDALTGLAWINDSRVCIQKIKKVYGDRPGAIIEIRELIVAECTIPSSSVDIEKKNQQEDICLTV